MSWTIWTIWMWLYIDTKRRNFDNCHCFYDQWAKIWGEYWKYLYLTIHKTQYVYVAWSTGDFMMKMTKSQKMPLFKMPMSQNNRMVTQISVLPYPMRGANETLILLAIYEASLELSQIYWPVAVTIDIGWCQYRNFPNFTALRS